MKLELAQTHFSGGVGDFDIGHVLTDAEGNPEIKIVQFSGYSEIDEADGTEHETINVHFSDGSMIEFDTLERAVFIKRTYQPVSPDWFVIEVNGDTEEQAEIEATAQGENRSRAQGKRQIRPSRRNQDANSHATD